MAMERNMPPQVLNEPVQPLAPSIPAEMAPATELSERMMLSTSPNSHVPGPSFGQQVDHLDLKVPTLEAERKNKNKKKTIMHDFARGLWFRRALMKGRDKAKEKSEKSNTPTKRGLWRMANLAIGLALNAPNQTIQIPGKKRSDSYHRYKEA